MIPRAQRYNQKEVQLKLAHSSKRSMKRCKILNVKSQLFSQHHPQIILLSQAAHFADINTAGKADSMLIPAIENKAVKTWGGMRFGKSAQLLAPAVVDSDFHCSGFGEGITDCGAGVEGIGKITLQFSHNRHCGGIRIIVSSQNAHRTVEFAPAIDIQSLQPVVVISSGLGLTVCEAVVLFRAGVGALNQGRNQLRCIQSFLSVAIDIISQNPGFSGCHPIQTDSIAGDQERIERRKLHRQSAIRAIGKRHAQISRSLAGRDDPGGSGGSPG